MKEQINNLPVQFRPLSPWAYFGLSLLFSVPVVGFVFLIVFSISRANINRRNFARSYFCALILVLIIVGVCILLSALGVISNGIVGELSNMLNV